MLIYIRYKERWYVAVCQFVPRARVCVRVSARARVSARVSARARVSVRARVCAYLVETRSLNIPALFITNVNQHSISVT
jgi:hypothetical protein